MNKCHACESKSVIQDNKVWTCWQHIKPCGCKQDHEKNVEWDFNQSRAWADGISIEGMSYQTPEMRVPDGHGGYLVDVDAPPFSDIDRKDDPKILDWLDKKGDSEVTQPGREE